MIMLQRDFGSIFALAAVLLLTACGGGGGGDDRSDAADVAPSPSGRSTGQSVNPGQYRAIAVADEPIAINAAQEALVSGGNAADAAAATYFALSVTLPDAAGLAGGGACLYWDNKDRLAYGVNFPAVAPKDGGIIAVPGAVAGMNYLHARFGRLPWGSVVAPAERLARHGHRMSRANSVRFDRLDNGLKNALVGVGINSNAAGQAAKEGDRITNPALADLLTEIRTSGGKAFYTPGKLQARMLLAIKRAGGRVGPEDLVSYRAQPGLEQVETRGDYSLFLHGGLAASPLVGALVQGGDRRVSLDQTIGAGVVERKANEMLHDVKANHTGSTGFTIVDVMGNSATCALTMGRPFGGAGLSSDLGISFAAPIDSDRAKEAAEGLVPFMIAANDGGVLYMSAVATGGLGAAESAVVLAQNYLVDLEDDGPGNLGAALADANRNPAISVSAVSCPAGADQRLSYCVGRPDSVGYGLAKLISDLPR